MTPTTQTTTEETKLSGEATSEQIKSWKDKHKYIYEYKVDGMICYLRAVDRDLFSLATAKMSTSPAKFNEEVIKGIWLGGDETIRKDDRYYFGLIEHVEELMDKKKGSLVAL